MESGRPTIIHRGEHRNYIGHHGNMRRISGTQANERSGTDKQAYRTNEQVIGLLKDD